MDGFRIRTVTLVVASALIGVGAGLALGLFGDDEPMTPTTAIVANDGSEEPAKSEGQDPTGPAKEPDLPRTEDDPAGAEPGPSGPAPTSAEEVAAADAARAYVTAITQRNGKRVCAAFAAGGLADLKLPAQRGSCAASIEASLGFRGQGGQPVWNRSEMTQDVSAQIDGDSARVVATVFTEYADIREPTIEDDIIYLARSGDRWLVAKPSATLYRAIGIADVPLSALQPPG